MEKAAGDKNNHKSNTSEFIEKMKQRLILSNSCNHIPKSQSSRSIKSKHRPHIKEDVDKMALLNKVNLNYNCSVNTRKDTLSQTQCPSQARMINSATTQLNEAEIELMEKYKKGFNRLHRFNSNREIKLIDKRQIAEIKDRNIKNLKVTSIIKYKDENDKSRSESKSQPKNKSRQAKTTRLHKWLTMNEIWIGEKKRKLEVKKKCIEYIEKEDEDFIFQPQVNVKNIRLNNQENYIGRSNINNLDVCNRLYHAHNAQKQHIRKITKELTPSFKPIINKNYPVSTVYYDYMNQNQEEIYHSLIR